MTRWTLACAFLVASLTASAAAKDSNPQQADRAAAVKELVRFVSASDRARLEDFSRGRIRATEVCDGLFGLERVDSVAWDGVISMHAERFPRGTQRSSIDVAEPESLYVVTRAHGRWLSAGQSKPGIPGSRWNATIGTRVPATDVFSRIFFRLTVPFRGISLSDQLERHEVVAAARDADRIVLDIAATADVAQAARGEAEFDIVGALGWSVTVRIDAACRVESMRTIIAARPGADGVIAIPEGVQRYRFGRLDGIVESVTTLSDWKQVGEALLPARTEFDLVVRVAQDGSLEKVDFRQVSEVEYALLQSLPPGFEVDLVPPPVLGDVGVLTDLATGRRRVYDARSEAERDAERNELVDRMTQAGTDLAGAEGSGWGTWIVVLLAVAVVMAAAWVRRRRRART